jgi:anti-anti-sigma regulatory factor
MTESAKSVVLPAVLDLDALDAVRDRLIEAIDLGHVTVGGAGVERVATNGLLMLLSAAGTAGSHGFSFALEAPSAAMLAAIERLGLTLAFAGFLKG